MATKKFYEVNLLTILS